MTGPGESDHETEMQGRPMSYHAAPNRISQLTLSHPAPVLRKPICSSAQGLRS
jgi:hypothetical protein